MDKNIIGEIGEQLVVLELLKSGYDVCRPVNKNQKNWDVIVARGRKFKKIQVKTTTWNAKTTNNVVRGVNKQYDFLVIVVRNYDVNQFFILSKSEVEKINSDKSDFAITEIKNGERQVREYLMDYEVISKEDWIKKLGME